MNNHERAFKAIYHNPVDMTKFGWLEEVCQAYHAERLKDSAMDVAQFLREETKLPKTRCLYMAGKITEEILS